MVENTPTPLFPQRLSSACPDGRTPPPTHAPRPRPPGGARGVAPQAGVAPGAGPRGAELPRAEAPDAGPPAAYGVRGSPLPQHRGVLGAPSGHLHDPGRRVHAELRLLRGRPRDPASARSGRARTARRSGGPDGTEARRDHERRPRRPAARWGGDLRGVRRRDPATAPRDLG